MMTRVGRLQRVGRVLDGGDTVRLRNISTANLQQLVDGDVLCLRDVVVQQTTKDPLAHRPQPQNTIFLLLMNEPSLFLFGLSKSVNFCFPVVELIVVNAVSFVKRKILTPALRFFNSEFSARGLSDL